MITLRGSIIGHSPYLPPSGTLKARAASRLHSGSLPYFYVVALSKALFKSFVFSNGSALSYVTSFLRFNFLPDHICPLCSRFTSGAKAISDTTSSLCYKPLQVNQLNKRSQQQESSAIMTFSSLCLRVTWFTLPLLLLSLVLLPMLSLRWSAPPQTKIL